MATKVSDRITKHAALLTTVLTIVLLFAGPAFSQNRGNIINVGLAPYMIGSGGDQVEEDLYRYLGQQDVIDRIYNPNNPDHFFQILGKIKASGKRIGVLVIAGHGSYDTPGVGLSGEDLMSRDVNYCQLKREAHSKYRRMVRNANYELEDEDQRKAYYALKKKVELIGNAAGVMAPNGLVVVLSCSVAASELGRGVLKNLGSVLMANGGGRIVGSATDNTAGQFRSHANQLWTALRNRAYDEVGNYFVYGDFKEYRINGSAGRLNCPGVPDVLPDLPRVAHNQTLEGWNGTWSITSTHELPPIKNRHFSSTLVVRVEKGSCRYDWGINRNAECRAWPTMLKASPKHPSGTDYNVTLVRRGNRLIEKQSKFNGHCGPNPCKGTYAGHR